MSDKLIEVVAKAICQSAIDENGVASRKFKEAVSFARMTEQGPLWQSFTTDAEIVLFAIEASGYAVVPKKPTEEMTEAGYALDKYGDRWPADMDDIWKAMLAAAPKVTP